MMGNSYIEDDNYGNDTKQQQEEKKKVDKVGNEVFACNNQDQMMRRS